MTICINKLLKLQNYEGAWAVAAHLSLTASFSFHPLYCIDRFCDLLFLPGDLGS
jgi:hypothetical protein